MVRHACQLSLSAKDKLALTGKAPDLLHNIILRQLILGLTLRVTLCNFNSVKWCRNIDDNVNNKQLRPEINTYANTVLDLRLTDLINNNIHFKQ